MIRLVLAFVLCLCTGVASAEKPDTCTDSGFYSEMKFLSDMCWNCLMPIKIMGVAIAGSSGNTSSSNFMSAAFEDSNRGENKLPKKTASPICVCPGRFYGMPSPGITWGMWFPTHTMETTRRPWCSPTLFGNVLSDDLGGAGNEKFKGITVNALDGGMSDSSMQAQPGNDINTVFHNWHWLTFPVYEMLESFMSSLCSPGGMGGDMSYVYFTEFDPTWDNEMLALYTHPEIKVFSSIYAQAACTADSILSSTNRPINEAFWCAGTWGSIYPYSGIGKSQPATEAQMLANARGMAAMHRRGLAKLTYGDRAVCHDAFWFVYPKHQYQYQNIWPVPQKKQAQWTGASSFRWGQHRQKAVTGEDRVTLLFTYKECCYTFW